MLFITGHPLDQESRDLLENQIPQSAAGVCWLQKPFTLQDFITLLRQILDTPVLLG
jgi:hypothetical protein